MLEKGSAAFEWDKTVTNRYENGAIKIAGNCAKVSIITVVLTLIMEKNLFNFFLNLALKRAAICGVMLLLACAAVTSKAEQMETSLDTFSALRFYNAQNFLQALRHSKLALATSPTDKRAMQIMLQSMAGLAIGGSQLKAAVGLARETYPNDVNITAAIAQLYQAAGQSELAQYYADSYRRRCVFNCIR